jgi:uncharacterized protein with HEPN domain
LRDIATACEECLHFVEGLTFEEFNRDRKTQLAVVKELEIIGEAAGKLPRGIRNAGPEVPWPAIIGMRNRLTHEYFRVNYETVWRTVHTYLKPLHEAVTRLR